MLSRMENGIAVHVEEWLSTITRSRGTKAKIRNIMSAVCSHAVRYGWMTTNPIRAVRQSAKRERVVVPLVAEELQKLFGQLGPRERTLVLLDVPTGMRRGEVLATQWCDIDFGKRTLNIRKSIWQQHLGPVKTEESEKVMPLDDEMITDLLRWRGETRYAKEGDWIFASNRMKADSRSGQKQSCGITFVQQRNGRRLRNRSPGTYFVTRFRHCLQKTMKT